MDWVSIVIGLAIIGFALKFIKKIGKIACTILIIAALFLIFC